MKFRHLALANLFRKKTRLVLTVSSFVVALFIFGILALLKLAFDEGSGVAGVDRLAVIDRVSIIQPLPLSYRDTILRIPGVKRVTFDNWFGGIYQDQKNSFPQFAVDIENQREVFPELEVPPDQWQAFARDRQGAVVGAATAKRFGWKIGDRIPLRGTIFPGTWEFNIDGIYHGQRPGADETQFWFQWKYLEERNPDRMKGRVGWYTVRVEKPEDSVRIAKSIDSKFGNSPHETHTDTEKAFAASFAKQVGNIAFLVQVVGAIVFFTLLMVTCNILAIAVRERTSEMAVLKAIGFSDRFVMLQVLAESLCTAVLGGAIGLGLAKGFSVMLSSSGLGNILPKTYLPTGVLLTGLALTLAFGTASGLLPALGTLRLRVVDAFRKV